MLIVTSAQNPTIKLIRSALVDVAMPLQRLGNEVLKVVARNPFVMAVWGLIVACALTISLSLGIPLGIAAATRPGSRLDTFVTSFASLGVALVGGIVGAVVAVRFLAPPSRPARSRLANPRCVG